MVRTSSGAGGSPDPTFGDYFGVIVASIYMFCTNLFDTKHENHLKRICFRFVRLVAVWGYLARDGDGGGDVGTMLGILYICLTSLLYVF